MQQASPHSEYFQIDNINNGLNLSLRFSEAQEDLKAPLLTGKVSNFR